MPSTTRSTRACVGAAEVAPVLQVEDLTVLMDGRGGPVPVIEHLSFTVEAGRTMALVGESGCGKSVTALAIMRLLPEGFRYGAGRIRLEGEDVIPAGPRRLHALRGNRMSMIFQEPMTALNPVFSVGDQIAEVLRLHQGLGTRGAFARALDLLKAVQIPAPETRLRAFPHQLSGGMRQRVMIAMALACWPVLLIADEPTTALDVTVQAQVFDLLKDMQRDMGTAIVLITHDLGAVADVADEIAVLYAGRCVERGTATALMAAPRHPYTAGLMACLPRLHLGLAAATDATPLPEIAGMVPPLGSRPAICAFAARCPHADGICRSEPQPALVPAALGHDVACRHQLEPVA